MNELLRYFSFQGNDGGASLLVSIVFVVIILVSLAYFFGARFQKSRLLGELIKNSDGIRTLTPYEKLRIKHFFDREIQSRHLEGYQNRLGNVGDKVFCIEGPVRKHEFRERHRVISSYMTIAGLEMLVPAAGTMYLQTENSRVQFVMVGSVAFVINVNDQFDLGLSSTESDQPEVLANNHGNSLKMRRLNPLEIPGDAKPLHPSSYLQSIAGDKLLVSDASPSAVSLKFMVGIYWGILLTFCGLFPVAMFVFAILFAGTNRASEMALEVFLYFWPYVALFLCTFPFALIVWVINQASMPEKYVLVFDRNSRQVLFLRKGFKPVRVGWKKLYALVETASWRSPYGYSLQETFLELATATRDCSDRVAVRLPFSGNLEAIGTWRAIQDFMNDNLQAVTQNPGAESERALRRGTVIHTVAHWLLGGPLADRLVQWVTQQKQKVIWRLVAAHEPV